MRSAVDAVIDRWQKFQEPPKAEKSNEAVSDADSTETSIVDIRTAALVLAIERVSSVTLERGIWP